MKLYVEKLQDRLLRRANVQPLSREHPIRMHRRYEISAWNWVLPFSWSTTSWI